jgi:hypothetical protein
MADEIQHPTGPDSEHVRRTFDSWKESLGDRVKAEDERRVLGIRDAVVTRDTSKAREHLEQTKIESNWLYEELMKHPEIQAIFMELAIFGL